VLSGGFAPGHLRELLAIERHHVNVNRIEVERPTAATTAHQAPAAWKRPAATSMMLEFVIDNLTNFGAAHHALYVVACALRSHYFHLISALGCALRSLA
jgi:hypothetical protein